MATYRLRAEAEQDLTEIWNYGLEQFGEAQADRFLMAFFDHFQDVANAPLTYPIVPNIPGGYRRSVFQKHSVYYVPTDDGVEIKTIIGRQDINAGL